MLPMKSLKKVKKNNQEVRKTSKNPQIVKCIKRQHQFKVQAAQQILRVEGLSGWCGKLNFVAKAHFNQRLIWRSTVPAFDIHLTVIDQFLLWETVRAEKLLSLKLFVLFFILYFCYFEYFFLCFYFFHNWKNRTNRDRGRPTNLANPCPAGRVPCSRAHLPTPHTA